MFNAGETSLEFKGGFIETDPFFLSKERRKEAYMVLRGERKGIEKKFFELSTRVVEEQGLKVYDLDYLPGTYELRLYIYDPESGTAQIEDCVRIDQAMTPFIEEEEWVPSKLTLEVSSPGLYRQLTTKEHFEGAVGEKVSLQLMKKLQDVVSDEVGETLSRKVRGEKKVVAPLTEVNEEGISVELEQQNVAHLSFNDIKKANLETDIDVN